jgi:hypothetical protein
MIILLLPPLLAALQSRPDPAANVRQTAAARVDVAKRIAADPQVVGAVVARNRAPDGPDAIARKDREWRTSPSYPLRKELTTNACATRLRELVGGDPVVVEAFVMDDRGGLVCATVETSDYWQGDEAKWQKTYGDGHGVFVDEPALDVSTGMYAIQLSVLVSASGQKAGALTLTLKVPRTQSGR